jgi:hypothetical protein
MRHGCRAGGIARLVQEVTHLEQERLWQTWFPQDDVRPRALNALQIAVPFTGDDDERERVRGPVAPQEFAEMIPIDARYACLCDDDVIMTGERFRKRLTSIRCFIHLASGASETVAVQAPRIGSGVNQQNAKREFKRARCHDRICTARWADHRVSDSVRSRTNRLAPAFRSPAKWRFPI